MSLDGTADDGNALAGFADNLRADIEHVVDTDRDDALLGSAAANVLDGAGGDNRLEGRAGHDTLKGDRGSDLLDGGDGLDTATYQGHTPVTVTLDGIANDGTPEDAPGVLLPVGFQSELDNVLTENVIGGGFGDTITGDDRANVLSGGGREDTLRGAGGDDQLDGGAGRDTMLGEAGGDLLLGNDGLADRVDCGPDLDVANLDLADAADALRGGGLLPASAGCEQQNLAPAGRLPNVKLASKIVRIDHRGRGQLALRCPSRSPLRCSGTVHLQRPDGSRLSGGARFAIRRGDRATISVRLRRRTSRGLAQILAHERDIDGRPKLTLARVRLRP